MDNVLNAAWEQHEVDVQIEHDTIFVLPQINEIFVHPEYAVLPVDGEDDVLMVVAGGRNG